MGQLQRDFSTWKRQQIITKYVQLWSWLYLWHDYCFKCHLDIGWFMNHKLSYSLDLSVSVLSCHASLLGFSNFTASQTESSESNRRHHRLGDFIGRRENGSTRSKYVKKPPLYMSLESSVKRQLPFEARHLFCILAIEVGGCVIYNNLKDFFF